MFWQNQATDEADDGVDKYIFSISQIWVKKIWLMEEKEFRLTEKKLLNKKLAAVIQTVLTTSLFRYLKIFF